MHMSESGARKGLVAALAMMVLLGPAAGAAASLPDATAYARALGRFVTGQGRVRYAALKTDPGDLDAYLASLAALDRAAVEALPEAERIALWVNAYNAITLRTIVANYPIHGRGLSALRYPSSSIRQISGAWSDRRWVVAGSRVSLEDIEHETLRKRFQQPRVHMALVCAALGCPPLRNEPYQGAHLGEQLDDQARRYLASPAGLRVAPEHRRVEVSLIFKWFGRDFDAAGGVRGFLARHAPAAARDLLADPGSEVTYLDYDWSLNDAQGD